MELQYVTSQRGKRIAVLNGYLYSCNQVVTGRLYWRCVQRSCNSRMISEGSAIIRLPTAHPHHAPSADKVISAKVVSDVRCKAVESETSTRNIIQEVKLSLPISAMPVIPSDEALGKIIRRKRKLEQEGGEELDHTGIPRFLQLTSTGTSFLIHAGELLVFCSVSGMKILENNRHWFGDGTFYIAPNGFKQLYTVHALIGESVTVPCCYALLKDKSVATYSAMLNALSNISEQIRPESITLDFESAAISAFKTKFPDSILHGCYFHLCQSIWRHIQGAGLQSRYAEDSELALQALCLLALAFVPTDEVVAAFDTLTSQASFPDELDPIVDYFESTYVGNIGRGGRRRRPLFPAELWSQYDCVCNELPRTTNSLEGWHNALNGSIGKAHPSVNTLLKQLQREEASVNAMYERASAGHQLPKTKNKYRKVTERLQAIVRTYPNTEVLQYLRSIAHNFSL